MHQWQSVLFFLWLVCGFSDSIAIDKESDGIILKIAKQQGTDAHLIKVQVCSDNIIRVIASPGDKFSHRQSLMASQTNWPPVPFTTTEKEKIIELSTSKLIIKIHKQTGAVTFYDKSGNLILDERAGGKIINPAVVMGENTYNIRQVFNSPEEEAIYGLGAHQNNIWNYKGHDIDLWQYNIVDIVPFLVSSNNYGILWDNNSRTKFGDIREYGSISSLKLFDKNGNEGGLTAEYFKDQNFNELFTSRTENRIEHEYLDVNDDYPEGFARNVQAVRWSGEIQCDDEGIHKLRLYSSGYAKMWLDGELVVDSWRQNWLPWTNNPTIKMSPGKSHKIKIEWIHTGGYIGLKFLCPDKNEIKNTISLYSEVADQIDYYFIKGENADEVISGYRAITGKAPMMPKWAMGLWQSRERYKSQEEILSIVKEFRKRGIPLDNIVQDWFYWEEDKWGNHDFDNSRFPNPDQMIKTLHNDLNTRLMISVWPKFYVGTKNYEQFSSKGWLYTRNIEKKQLDWVGPGYISTFYDPYNSEAGKLFWRQIDEKLFSKGVDAWWLDATEPDIHSNLSPTEALLRVGPTALGSTSRYLNTYSLMNAKSVYEGQRQSDNDKRVFILTRSAFAGQQRYSTATWSGDIASRWYDLKAQIPAGLNFSLSGIPYWTNDIGGFAVELRFEHPSKDDLEEWRELNTRWFQFGTFCPLFRVHGQFPYREIFNIAPESHQAYQSMLSYDKLRYRLMPYIYSLTGMVTHNDYTIMRALMMDFSKDEKTKHIGDQYMFGPALLINPVTEYKARSRNVYLPAGTNWYDLKTGILTEGGQYIVADAPYSDMPVFVKAGSIIPGGPELQFTSEKPAETVRLFVYTGEDGSFSLYEDENLNNNYEKGKFANIPFTYSEKNKTLTIGQRKGAFAGMLEKRTFEVLWISKDKKSGMDFNVKPDEVVQYDGSEITVSLK